MNKPTDQFYTLKGYQKNTHAPLTAAMEDYLEMICRILADKPQVRVMDLARTLHVRPSSVSKMVQQLNASGYIHAMRYGYIQLTDKGQKMGAYLLYRHEVLLRFLRTLNQQEDELEEAEKIEHFLTPNTVHHLDQLTQYMQTEPFFSQWKKENFPDKESQEAMD